MVTLTDNLLPLDQTTAKGIIDDVVARIKKGEVIEPRRRYADIIKGYEVLFIKTNDGQRDLLRLIFPDPDGSLDPEAMAPSYAVQYTVKP